MLNLAAAPAAVRVQIIDIRGYPGRQSGLTRATVAGE